MINAQELLGVKTVYDAIGILCEHFGEPFYDQDPQLIQGLGLLQEYCMTRKDSLAIVQGAKGSREQ